MLIIIFNINEIFCISFIYEFYFKEITGFTILKERTIQVLIMQGVGPCIIRMFLRRSFTQTTLWS